MIHLEIGSSESGDPHNQKPVSPSHKRVSPIAKIFVYKDCFCYFNAENIKQKDSLFYEPISSLIGLLKITMGDSTDIFAIHHFS